jgi:hypothetical protein
MSFDNWDDLPIPTVANLPSAVKVKPVVHAVGASASIAIAEASAKAFMTVPGVKAPAPVVRVPSGRVRAEDKRVINGAADGIS